MKRHRNAVLIGAGICVFVVLGIFAILPSQSEPRLTLTAKPPGLNSTNWMFSVQATNTFLIVGYQGELLIGDQKGNLKSNVSPVLNRHGLGGSDVIEFEIAVPSDANEFQLIVPVQVLSRNAVEFVETSKAHTPEALHPAIKGVAKGIGYTWRKVAVKSGLWTLQQESWREKQTR